MVTESHDVTLVDVAAGGTLFFGDHARIPRGVSITTSPGETCDNVMERLAEELNLKDPFGIKIGYSSTDPNVYPTGCSFKASGMLGEYFFSGSEMGLGLPPSPKSVTSRLDDTGSNAIVEWENPPGGYDGILIVCDQLPCCLVQGDQESCLINKYADVEDRNFSDMEIRVVGSIGERPSCPGAIRLRNEAIEELHGIPFQAGVSPNWRAWSVASGGTVVLKEGIKTTFVNMDSPFQPVMTPDEKPNYQKIWVQGQNGSGGVFRNFVGLRPGHKYKASFRLNSLAMDSHASSWTFSCHAAYNDTGGDFTVDQMNGTTALPDGSTGKAAGRIAQYGNGSTTSGNWIIRSSGDGGVGSTIGDVILPQAVDKITVWIRHEGSSTSGVAFDWIRLEDLGPAN